MTVAATMMKVTISAWKTSATTTPATNPPAEQPHARAHEPDHRAATAAADYAGRSWCQLLLMVETDSVITLPRYASLARSGMMRPWLPVCSSRA